MFENDWIRISSTSKSTWNDSEIHFAYFKVDCLTSKVRIRLNSNLAYFKVDFVRLSAILKSISPTLKSTSLRLLRIRMNSILVYFKVDCLTSKVRIRLNPNLAYFKVDLVRLSAILKSISPTWKSTSLRLLRIWLNSILAYFNSEIHFAYFEVD